MKKTAETKQHIPYIDNPEELRKLSPEQLPEVCADIRKCIIENLSSNPGHFASSMGAVEIIVALHYVMNTPDDKLVWDVGHQAYAHKILTGRRKNFDTLRKAVSRIPRRARMTLLQQGTPPIPSRRRWAWLLPK